MIGLVPLLLAASVAAADDSSDRLRDMFVGACLRAKISADLVEEVPFGRTGKDLLPTLDGAGQTRLFTLKGFKDSYLVFAEFSGRTDGVVQQCGVFSPEWTIQDARAAAFVDLDNEGNIVPSKVPEFLGSRTIGGGRYGKGLASQLAYGRKGRRSAVLLSIFDAETAQKRRSASETLLNCSKEDRPAGLDCGERAKQSASQILAAQIKF